MHINIINATKCLTLLLGLSLASTTLADSPPSPSLPPADPDPWKFTVAPYVWAPSVEGQIAVRNTSISIDQDFAQILHDSDSIIGVMGDFEVHKGRWGAFVNGVYMRIGVDNVGPGPINANLTNEIIFIEAAGMYRFADFSLAPKNTTQPAATTLTAPSISLDGYLGARYTHLGFGSDFQRGFNVQRSKDFVDPLIGTRVLLNLDKHWQLMFQGDVGGFGAGSQIALAGTALIGYKFNLDTNLDLTLYAGYRALYQDFASGNLDWKVTLHGPILGLAFEF